MVKQWGLIGAILTLPFLIMGVLLMFVLSPLLIVIIIERIFHLHDTFNPYWRIH